jgi:hypothetical protein
MALQLPTEFPLGLVFVVGKVRNLTNADGDQGDLSFFLVEHDHQLRCRLSDRAAAEVTLNEGDMIRAGGHLAFDTFYADYYLLARDIEVLPEHRPSRTTLAPILADIKKRSQAASLAPAELPVWVQQIAPPEVRQAVEEEADTDRVVGSADDGLSETVRMEVADEQARERALGPIVKELEERPEELPEEPFLPGGFTDDLVEFLSEAMDSPEDVELTQEMMDELAPAIRSDQLRFKAAHPYDVTHLPAQSRVPWIVVLLVLLFLITFLGVILFLAISAIT